MDLDYTPKSGSSGTTNVSVTTGTHTGNAKQTQKIRFKINDQFYDDLTVIKSAAAVYLKSTEAVSIAWNKTTFQIKGSTNATTFKISGYSANDRTIHYKFVSGSVTKEGDITMGTTSAGTAVTIDLGTLNAAEAHDYTIDFSGLSVNMDSSDDKQTNIMLAVDSLAAKRIIINQDPRPAYYVTPTNNWTFAPVAWTGGTLTLQATTNATSIGILAGVSTTEQMVVPITAKLGGVTKTGTLTITKEASINFDFGLDFTGEGRTLEITMTIPKQTGASQQVVIGNVIPNGDEIKGAAFSFALNGKPDAVVTPTGSWNIETAAPSSGDTLKVTGKTTAPILYLIGTDSLGSRDVPVKVTVGSFSKTVSVGFARSGAITTVVETGLAFDGTNRDLTIEIQVPENNLAADRDCTLSVQARDDNKKAGNTERITFAQEQKLEITISPTSLNFNWDDVVGDSKTITLTANAAWKYQAPAEADGFNIVVYETSGSAVTGKTLKIETTQNDGSTSYSKKARYYLTDNSSVYKELTVTKTARPIFLTKSNIWLPTQPTEKDAHTVQLAGKTNAKKLILKKSTVSSKLSDFDVSVIIKCGSVTRETTINSANLTSKEVDLGTVNALKSNSLYIEIAFPENTGDDRTLAFDVQYGDTSQVEHVVIVQNAAASITVDKDTLIFAADDSKAQSVTITSTGNWTATEV